MPFVRYKMVKGRRYYQLVRNYRENGKHRQQMLCHLGQHKSLDEAIDHEQRAIATHLREAASQEKEAASTKAYLFEFYGDRFTDKLPTYEEADSAWYAAYIERAVVLREAGNKFLVRDKRSRRVTLYQDGMKQRNGFNEYKTTKMIY